MPKIVDGKEYLTYDEIAEEYGYNRSYVPSMVTNRAFPNIKFEKDVKRYVSREDLEAYKHRKDKASTTSFSATSTRPVSQDMEKERSTQDAPFPANRHNKEILQRILDNEKLLLENE